MSLPRPPIKGQPRTGEAHMLRQLIEHVRSITPCSSADICVSHTPSGTLFNFRRRPGRIVYDASPLALLRHTPFGIQGYHTTTGNPYIRAGRIIQGSTEPVIISGAGMGLDEGDASTLVAVEGGSAAAPAYIYAWLRPDDTSGLSVGASYPLPTPEEWRQCLYSVYRAADAEVVIVGVHHVGDIVRLDEIELTVCIDGVEETRTFYIKKTDV